MVLVTLTEVGRERLGGRERARMVRMVAGKGRMIGEADEGEGEGVVVVV